MRNMKKAPTFLALMLVIASIVKAQSCQPFTLELNTQQISHPVFDLNEIKVCLGDTLILAASADFPNNNLGYEQTLSNTNFIWSFEFMEPDTGIVLFKKFEETGIRNFNLRGVDVNGCLSSNQINGKIFISGNPIVQVPTLMYAPVNSVIVLNASEDQNSTLVFEPIEISIPPVASDYINTDTVFLPDGNGTCYNDDLTILGFQNNQILSHVQQIKSIYINMEHTYLEDVSIRVTCPSGKTAVLKTYNGTLPAISPGGVVANACSSYGGGINLGCPIDAPSHNLCYLEPGVGYDYEFRPGATGCFGLGGLTIESSFTDPCGTNWVSPSLRPSVENSYTTTPTVPVYYGSYQDLSVFVGCPLNGNWRITVCDHIAYDNGYIFKWGIQFDESLQTNPTSYYIAVDSVSWSGNNLSTLDPFSASVFHTSAGIYNYTASVYDRFGCQYDTCFSIQTTVSVEDYGQISKVKVFPNPTQGVVHIYSEESEIEQFQLYSVNGKLLYEQKVGLLEMDLDLSNFPSGVYLCTILSLNGTKNEIKIIKK